MGRSQDYNEWEDRISRKNRKAETRKNRKRVNSNELMERYGRNNDDDDLYNEGEKFHHR
jgi:hypothetical protein